MKMMEKAPVREASMGPASAERALRGLAALACLLLLVAPLKASASASANASASASASANASASASASDRDWPRWSGPDRNLTSLGNGVFEAEDFGLERLWQRDLGSGYSGVVAAGDLLLTGFSDGVSDFLVCLEASSGDERWRYRIGDTYKGHTGSDDGPIATPTIAGDQVFNIGPWGRLAALRLESGEEIWSHDLLEVTKSREPEYGFTSTPLVVDDLVVMQTGGPDGRAITAFDRSSGEVRWSTGDDPISYQSPQLLEIGGRRHLMAVTDEHFLGLDPKTGTELWRQSHGSISDHPFAHPVAVGENGVLLTYWPETALFRILEEEGSFRAEEAWRRNTLQSSYATPIPYQGTLYGFSGRFLTAVDAETGKSLWKSREPKGISLVLVDGHLVILTLDGELVVAEATPEGYVEKARVQALEEGNHTRPSFASGRFFVRNLAQIAAVQVGGAAAAVAEVEVPELRGDFGRFVGTVLAAEPEARQGMVEEYLAENLASPVVEEEGLSHFLYQGDIEDLALVGYLFPDGNEARMFRIPGTDLWFHSVVLPPASQFAYTYSVFDESFPDPRNPLTQGAGAFAQSVLTTEGWIAPAHLEEIPEGPRGRLEAFTWKSEILDNEREVQVYLPVGYDESEERYPVLFVNSGDLLLSDGYFDRALDHLIGARVAPLIAVFVPRSDPAEFGGDGTGDFTRALTQELLPRIDSTYRTRASREARGILGVGSGAFAALYSTFHERGSFSRVAALSYYHGNLRPALMEGIESEGEEVHALFLWSSHDYADPAEDFIARRDAQEVAATVKESGGSPTILEVTDGAGWGMWTAAYDRILEWFFPAEALESAGMKANESSKVDGEQRATHRPQGDRPGDRADSRAR
ncbi:MAG: PQQ-binding-like beta-propeller repeat protein [Acidobacteriota bacterium]